MINVKFEVMSKENQIRIIQDFLSSENDLSNIIATYFNIELKDFNNENKIKLIVENNYDLRIKDLEKSKIRFQKVWDENQEFLNNEFKQIFKENFDFNCKAYVNLNPVWPRFLKKKSFDVNLDSNDGYLLLSSAHEIVHFIWFEIFKRNFPNIKKENYEYPNIAWFVSELAIEPIFEFSNLKKLSTSKPAYDYFYTDKIGDKTLAQIANQIFKESKNIDDFQKNMMAYFEKVENINKIIK